MNQQEIEQLAQKLRSISTWSSPAPWHELSDDRRQAWIEFTRKAVAIIKGEG